ncbi:hypothetical protein AA313_de0204405 [Arthrobotrys entomopaga]|nr:hypothetical protein AA313_de0204405 [Arthrobotrys entomopaga]
MEKCLLKCGDSTELSRHWQINLHASCTDFSPTLQKIKKGNRIKLKPGTCGGAKNSKCDHRTASRAVRGRGFPVSPCDTINCQLSGRRPVNWYELASGFGTFVDNFLPFCIQSSRSVCGFDGKRFSQKKKGSM